jgi:polysaccharide pyruvyl transferase WcaK-like protein
VIIRRDCFDKVGLFDEKLKQAQDYDLWLRMEAEYPVGFISSRFHSLIAGLSQQVPILAIGWSHKYRELLQLFDLEEYCLDYRKLNNQEGLDFLVKAWNEKDNNCRKIKKGCLFLNKK